MNEIEKEIFHGCGSWAVNLLFPRTVPLHSMLAGCGFETRCSPEYDYNGLQRGQTGFAIFQYTVDGTGSLDYEGDLHEMHSGDAMLLHVPHRHRYFLDEQTPFWRHCYLTITGSDAVRLMRESETRFGPVVKLPRESLPVREMLRILQLVRNGQMKSACAASAATYNFAAVLYDYLAAEKNGAGATVPQLLHKVHQFCLDHLSEDIDVTAMAREAGCSRAHFSRIFKHIYGIPPAQFLTELRLSSAIRMLQMEFCSIKEISDRCGFRDESYFCKVFRKFHHISPEKFRRGSVQDKNGKAEK